MSIKQVLFVMRAKNVTSGMHTGIFSKMVANLQHGDIFAVGVFCFRGSDFEHYWSLYRAVNTIVYSSIPIMQIDVY
jgi:hypothetical protein